jgi:hypothetical protein
MARTSFVGFVTKIPSIWLNKVDATIVDGLGEADTPAGVRSFIDATSQDDFTLHVGNTSDPHGLSNLLLDGYTVDVVDVLPSPASSDVIYFVRTP